MWAESQPGPSTCQPSRHGYCGYCRVLYNNLDQHLASLKHMDAVQKSSRETSTIPSVDSQTRQILLERFLSDVLEHHPHRYHDPWPSHADLPSVFTLPLPRAELHEFSFSDDDSLSPCTRKHLPTSDDGSFKLANRDKWYSTDSKSGERACQDRLSSSIRELEGCTCLSQPDAPPHLNIPATQCQAPPSIHKKAHRKTNRRKASETSSSRSPGGGGTTPQHLLSSCHDPVSQNPSRHWSWNPTGPKPWLSWQREKREAQKEEAFSSDYIDPLDQTIEEVIQMCCHGITSITCHQEELESLHLSLPVSMETQSEEWDIPIQVVLQGGGALTETPVQMTQTEGQDLSHLMDIQVDLENKVYSHQLDRALHSEHRAGGGTMQEEGFWTLPIEDVLPVPQLIPESFRGKSWAKIEQEDEEKVNQLVRQFRRETFLCYFDSESLARYGRRRHRKKIQGAEPDASVLPLVEQDDNRSTYVRSRRKRGSFRQASRCQVVKVSHSTQTIQLVVPAVQMTADASPSSIPAASQSAAETTPEMQMWRYLPSLYSNILSPVQPCTSVVYLLHSPSGSTPTTPDSSAHKRCRRRRRPLQLQRLKLTYKPLPVHFYEPGTNRILKNSPKGLTRHPGSTSSGPPPPCVRQLFRSLSPDLNTDQTPGQNPKGDTVLSRDTQTHELRRRRTMPHAPAPAQCSRSEQGQEDRTRQGTSKTRSSIQAPPLQHRREGLRWIGPSRKLPSSICTASLLSRRGKGRRGWAYKRTRR